MKNHLSVLLVLVAGLDLSTPSLRATSLSAAEQAKILAEVKPLMEEMAAACQRLDADAVTKDFKDSPETLAVTGEGLIADPATLREGLKDLYARLSTLKFTPIREEYRVLAPDLVLRVWSYRVDGVSKKRGPWFIEPETATALLRKSDGAWKCIFFQESSRPLKLVSATPASN